MNDKETTASYLDLSSQAYGLVVGAIAASNGRALEMSKSIWEIASRPYGSTALETTVRENFDRTNQIVALAISELETRGRKAAEFTEKSFSLGAKLQETFVQASRGLVETGISNANFVKDTATKSVDDMIKRVDDVQTHAAGQISHN
jgi:hypothetical protein